MNVRKLDWINTLFIGSAHLVALIGLVYVSFIHFSWWTLGLGLVWLAMCSLSITGGYHRLFAHSTYKTVWPLRALYLFFGAASVQNSALKWASDHRIHHARTDEDEDPYNIQRGFWWAHIGWVLHKEPEERSAPAMRDLHADRLVVFQDRWYILLAILAAVIVPAALGSLWGDALGAVLVCGFMRLVFQWHMTFSVNSFAHTIGQRPFCTRSSARDSFITALLTLGEGYHNFHHRFAIDYRNGFRWYHIDPTKWFVWLLSRVGLTWDLKRTSREAIQAARMAVRAKTQAQPD